MSKITFRAADDLVERIEALDASKSEVMREALRAYLSDDAGAHVSDLVDEAPDDGATGASDGDAGADGGAGGAGAEAGAATLDEVLFERVDRLVAERVDAHLESRGDPTRVTERAPPQDVNVNVTLEDARGSSVDSDRTAEAESASRKTPSRGVDTEAEPNADPEPTSRGRTCGQCGDAIEGDHVYCPNCGEKATHRVFCDCGDELRSDWAFCPGCGRRTPAADVLDGA